MRRGEAGIMPWRTLASVLMALVLAVACGGGVDSGGTGAPVQTFASGSITGFGSIVVNGVHFDESAAVIVDQDGNTHSRSALELGMTVEVEAGPLSVNPSTGVASAVASRVRFGSAIEGPVEAVDPTASTLTVLGQPVRVNADTVFGAPSCTLAELGRGDLVAVDALLDVTTGVYTATRIECRASLGQYRLRGVVSQVDAAAHTFTIGAAHIRYAGTVDGLVEGALLRIKLETAPQGGFWILAQALPAQPVLPDGVRAEIEGIVGAFKGLSSFKINGTLVDASDPDVVFEGGNSGDLRNGVRVVVEGTVRGGVLHADRVRIETKGQGDDDEKIELHGAIESVGPARSFVLRGNTVIYDDDTRFQSGTAADLAAGVVVTVKGKLTNDGTQVLATRIVVDKT